MSFHSEYVFILRIHFDQISVNIKHFLIVDFLMNVTPSTFHILYWTHGFSRKGPINSASSVRSFVCNADISGSARQKFLIFRTKLEQHKCRKVTFSNFRKKLLTPCGRGQKVKFDPKLDFFKDCFRTARQNFSIFCMKLDNKKVFQTMYTISSGTLLPRPSRGEKVKFWAQN